MMVDLSAPVLTEANSAKQLKKEKTDCDKNSLITPSTFCCLMNYGIS